MRISDWSSDVCSSDLGGTSIFSGTLANSQGLAVSVAGGAFDIGGKATIASLAVTDKGTLGVMLDSGTTGTGLQVTGNASFGDERSEEHTSELQSLMRLSYAVFCLKKKKALIITPEPEHD